MSLLGCFFREQWILEFSVSIGVDLGWFESLFSWYFAACAHTRCSAWFPLDATPVSPSEVRCLNRSARGYTVHELGGAL